MTIYSPSPFKKKGGPNYVSANPEIQTCIILGHNLAKIAHLAQKRGSLGSLT